MIPWLDSTTPFPDVASALFGGDAPGLLAVGADLSPRRLLDAYRHGIFPWFSQGQPILWWSTDPRMVLILDQFHVSDSLKKSLRKVARSAATDGSWQVRFDSAFEQVMRACAAPRKDGPGTWISDDIVAGYTGLHRLGYAHSSELWLNGELVAGAYGVSIGKMFFGESMFTRVTDGSKIALAYLVHFLKAHGVVMIDCQQQTAHLASLGAAPISRAQFLAQLQSAIGQTQITSWQPLAPCA
ncbi:MAG: leucyl/phenylalanyl-tRNA--protein transferase [Janthinobacterium sp.]|jgi:leucyl/phenylalanyl-tRNA--protein transferase